MLKRLREKIESKRNSKNLFWKVLVFLKDFLWKIKNSIWELSLYLKSRSALKKLIKGKRVLIVGSGTSAKELKEIPEDVLVFTCNAGLRLFYNKGYNKINLYLCHKRAIIYDYKDIKSLLKKIKCRVFVIDEPGYIKKELGDSYSILIKDYNDNNYYLKRLIKPYNINQIKGSSALKSSSGMRLLQYALFFKAKEIYLIGIDVNEKGYFWGERNEHKHLDIDRNLIKIVSKKYKNIYSVSKNSPITKFIPYKNLK